MNNLRESFENSNLAFNSKIHNLNWIFTNYEFSTFRESKHNRLKKFQ